MIWVLVAFGVLSVAAGASLAYVIGATGVLAFAAAGRVQYLAALPQSVGSCNPTFWAGSSRERTLAQPCPVPRN